MLPRLGCHPAASSVLRPDAWPFGLVQFCSCALTLPFAVAVWSDDDWLKKFSGKTLEENTEEAAAEAPKPEVQEVGKPTRAMGILAVLKSESTGQLPLEAEQMNVISTWFVFFFPAQGEPPAKKSRVNPQVYMDIKIGNKPAGRLQILLRSDVVPMTVGEERVSLPSVVASSCDAALTSLRLAPKQRISAASAPTRKALASKGAASTASSPSSCARPATSPTTTALEANPSMGRSLMMKTSFSSTRGQVEPFPQAGAAEKNGSTSSTAHAWAVLS